MLDAIRENSKSWAAKLVLGLIAITFSLFGVDSYLRQAGSNVAVAKVNGYSVTVQEFSGALQDLRNQMQASGKVDQAALDSLPVRESVLDKLIATHLMNDQIQHDHFMVSDDQLGKLIAGLPEFQQEGKFSQELYDRLLTQNHLTPTQFEARMRTNLAVQQVRSGVAAGAFASKLAAEQVLQVENQQREISVADVKAKDMLGQASVSNEQIKSYYEKNKDKFRAPEQVKIEYVIYSANNLITSMKVTDDEIKKYYTDNPDKFKSDEQRRASHILISFGGKTDEASKAEAKKKAEQVLAEVKKSPEKFAELAKKYSQDPSGEKGGDLGLFGRGMMVKPFEEAAFSLAPGKVSDLVESEFGYHIIKVTEIKGQTESFDDLKPKIQAEMMYQKAVASFAEQADDFNEKVYSATSLAPVAKAFGLQVQSSQWMSRDEAVKFVKSEKLVAAIFSNEVLKERHNTEAVEVSTNTIMAARVTDYKPSTERSFDDVKAGIEDYLKSEQALAAATKKGTALVADLKSGKDSADLSWIPAVVVDRKNAQGLSDAVITQAFKIDTSKLPAFGGVDNKGVGYSLIKVTQVKSALPTDSSAQKAAHDEVEAALGIEYLKAYTNSLKTKANISVNKQLLIAPPQQ